VLAGSEVNILPDGSPDYDDELLASLDWVIASVHTAFGITEGAMTERMIAGNAAVSFRLETRGETPIERVVSLVLLGDLVSIYLAALHGVDPGPVKALDDLKAALAKR